MQIPLSAEPLVGLKQPETNSHDQHPHLSAEPLVGLKRETVDRSRSVISAFSRTPRGFEAGPYAYRVEYVDDLSAEPLVGLKQQSAVVDVD